MSAGRPLKDAPDVPSRTMGYCSRCWHGLEMREDVVRCRPGRHVQGIGFVYLGV